MSVKFMLLVLYTWCVCLYVTTSSALLFFLFFEANERNGADKEGIWHEMRVEEEEEEEEGKEKQPKEKMWRENWILSSNNWEE